jgi:endonuclease/exonuclease/phosphatase (EEP) superfamily protein YafD
MPTSAKRPDRISMKPVVILPRNITPPDGRTAPRRRLLIASLQIAAWALIAATLAGFAGRLFWILDLFSHFRLHYFWGLTICAVTLSALKRHKLALIPGIFALVNLGLIVPLYLRDSRPTATSKTAGFRILSLNLQSTNREFGALREYVRQKSPDVAVFSTVSHDWAVQLEPLGAEFPYHKIFLPPDGGIYGIAIFSRHFLSDVTPLNLGDGNLAVGAGLIVESQPVTIFGVHTDSPRSRAQTASRDRQLARLAESIARQRFEVVVVGDLNTTSWSYAFNDLLRASDLRDSRAGFGVEASWPAALGPLGIAIDHCLISREISVKRREIGANICSDHRPLVVDLTVKAE